VWLPNLADASWLAGVLPDQAAALGFTGQVDSVRLLDARLTHPHRPESPLCRGWATCEVTVRGGAPALLYVKGYPDATAGEAARDQDRAARPDGHSVHLPSLDLVVWPFPDDPRLPALPVLVDADRVVAVLPPAVREVLGPGAPRTTVVRYQPEASITLRLETGRGTVFAKHLADGAVGPTGARHEAMWAAARRLPELRIAEPLGTDLDHGVLWTRGVPGPPIVQGVPADDLVAATGPVGALLAAVHRTATDAPALTVEELLAELDKKAGKLARAAPGVGPRVSGIVASATGRMRGVTGGERVATLHGDFHLDQLVTSEAGPVLVDLDSMVRGAPEVDLAEFLVDLALRDLPAGVARELGGALLASYAAASGTPIDEALLRICADAEFLNRCYRHLRRHGPGWQDSLATELARYDDVMALLPAGTTVSRDRRPVT
jgi:hypothetical protein